MEKLKEVFRSYWLHICLVAVVIVAVAYILLKGKSSEKIDAIEDSYRKEIAEIKQAQSTKKKQKEKLKKDYEVTVKKIEEKYLKKDQQLSSKHKKEVKELTKRIDSGDDKAIDEVAKTLGLKND